MSLYDAKIKDILTNADQYHAAYYDAATFGGPSLYFHRRALDTRDSKDVLCHLEYVYATLSSWGMHRMGKGGSKMQSFESFCQSVEPLQEQIAQAQQFDSGQVTEQQWSVLKSIFQGIRIMATGTSLVGNSKVMHHMMPNIVPPIDRQYTLRYLRGNTNILNNLDSEWAMMRGFIAGFFIPIASDPALIQRTGRWIASPDTYPWDTSVFKVIDNLIIGSMKPAPTPSI
jgi:hypothetical protein